MDDTTSKQSPAIRVKKDRRICDRCQDPNIVEKPDGTYRCKRCGYDSGK